MNHRCSLRQLVRARPETGASLGAMRDIDALTGPSRRVIGAWREPIRAEERGAFRFVFEIALPWIGRRARSIALGCVVALGGCDAQSVEVTGVVRDGRTGAPIAHAQITTDDGSAVETDENGRFTASAVEHLQASAPGRCAVQARRDAREITLRLFDRLEVASDRVEAGFDAEVRLEVRTPCDAEAQLTWTQIAGPELGERMRVEENGRVLVVRTHADGALEARPRREYGLRVAGTLGGERIARRARVVAFERAAIRRADGCAGAGCHDDEALARKRFAHEHTTSTVVGEWDAAIGEPTWCTTCHEEAIPSHGDAHLTAGCTSCHDVHDPARLRVFDTVAVGGEPAEHLGSGAVCASCHRAEVFIGRDARLAEPMDAGAHRFIANTCVRCHTSEDHSFAIRAPSGELRAEACAPCHGDGAPEAIGARDWDGDGVLGELATEHDRALGSLSERLRARITREAIEGACGRVAAGVLERDGRAYLVDARGALLGDCDDSGRIDARETAVLASALPRRLADAAHDLALLRADGSRGVHNPAYAFAVLSAVARALD